MNHLLDNNGSFGRNCPVSDELFNNEGGFFGARELDDLVELFDSEGSFFGTKTETNYNKRLTSLVNKKTNKTQRIPKLPKSTNNKGANNTKEKPPILKPEDLFFLKN